MKLCHLTLIGRFLLANCALQLFHFSLGVFSSLYGNFSSFSTLYELGLQGLDAFLQCSNFLIQLTLQIDTATRGFVLRLQLRILRI